MNESMNKTYALGKWTRKKENESGKSIKNNLMHNSISNKNDSRNFLKLQIQRKQRHGSELRHTSIAYPIGTNLIKKTMKVTGLLVCLFYY